MNSTMSFARNTSFSSTIRLVGPLLGGAVLFVGCGGSASSTDARDVTDDSAETPIEIPVVETAMELLPFDSGLGAPPAERTPTAIPDGIYRGSIDRTDFNMRLWPELLEFETPGASEMVVEIVEGQIESFSAAASFTVEPGDVGDGAALCASDETRNFRPDLGGAWIDDVTFFVPTVETITGSLDCDGFIEHRTDQFLGDLDAVGNYVDGVINVEFQFIGTGHGISSVLVAD